jgi:hypothetical protein
VANQKLCTVSHTRLIKAAFLAPQARAQLLPASTVLARRDAMQRSARKKLQTMLASISRCKHIRIIGKVRERLWLSRR